MRIVKKPLHACTSLAAGVVPATSHAQQSVVLKHSSLHPPTLWFPS